MPAGPFHTSLVPPTDPRKGIAGTAETRLDLSQKSKSDAAGGDPDAPICHLCLCRPFPRRGPFMPSGRKALGHLQSRTGADGIPLPKERSSIRLFPAAPA